MIRDVLWLMVTVGLACGWWIERNRSERNYVALQEARLEEAKRRDELTAEKNLVDRLLKAVGFYERVLAGGVTFSRPKTGFIAPANGYPID
jgi:hypothetical protein